MDEFSTNIRNAEVVLPLKDISDQHAVPVHNPSPSVSFSQTKEEADIILSIPFMQKLLAEVVDTWLLIFAGCASIVVNINKDKVVTLPGIAYVWGLTVMVLIHSVGHISGAHFNPAVTIAFASCNRFPWKQVPGYILAQVFGSTLAARALRLLFNGKDDLFAGTIPTGSNMQSFVIEFISTFYLMFVISGVATDNRAIGELAGLAIDSTIVIDVLFAGPISGASMNRATSLRPAIVSKEYRDLWIYMVAPVLGAVSSAWVYNMVRSRDKRMNIYIVQAVLFSIFRFFVFNTSFINENKKDCKHHQI